MVYQKALHLDFEVKFELAQEENSYGKYSSILRAYLVIFEGKRERADQISGLRMSSIFVFSLD